MKLIFIFVILSITFAFSQYTVEIRINDLWWSSYETWWVELEAMIYSDGNYIDPVNYANYYFEWWDYTKDWGWRKRESGRGVYKRE
jgi:hypothetical protein